MTMGAIITDVGTLATGTLSMAGEVVTFITSNPLVLCFSLIGFVGIGVGLVKRFIG